MTKITYLPPGRANGVSKITKAIAHKPYGGSIKPHHEFEESTTEEDLLNKIISGEITTQQAKELHNG